MQLKERLGFVKSWLLYYGKPRGAKNLLRFYASFIKPGMLCFDVGAHLGNRTSAWLKLGASVICIEPQPVCIRYLEKKFANNKRVQLISKGLGKAEGSSEMSISTLNPAVSTLSSASWMNKMKNAASFDLQWDKSIEVPMTTLDALIDEFGIPAFCKIDTEGYELDVLSGLSKPIPFICFEVISVHLESVNGCLQKINALARYEFNWSVGESLTFEFDEWVSSEEILNAITQYPKKVFSGDVYARMVS